MDLASLLGLVAILLIAALFLQFLWHVALLTLIWGPPAYLGITAGWWIFQLSSSAEASFAAAVVTNFAVRSLAVRMVDAVVRPLDFSALN